VTYEVEIQGVVRTVEVQRQGQETVVVVDGRPYHADGRPSDGSWSLLVREADAPWRSHDVAVLDRLRGALTVYVDGVAVDVVATARRPGSAARHRTAGPGGGGTGPQRVAAPMPGKIVKVLVQPGDVVGARQGLVVVEAMKMENELRSQRPGTVADVRVKEGMSVEAGTVLVVVE
jgi:biotin carboxyl carrier protein